MRTDEINVQVLLAESPDSAFQSLKASPPAAISGFKLVDESYNSLTYEKRKLPWYMAITTALSLGLRGPAGEIIYKFTARFDAQGDHQTKMTLVGMLDESTRAALGPWL